MRGTGMAPVALFDGVSLEEALVALVIIVIIIVIINALTGMVRRP